MSKSTTALLVIGFLSAATVLTIYVVGGHEKTILGEDQATLGPRQLGAISAAESTQQDGAIPSLPDEAAYPKREPVDSEAEDPASTILEGLAPVNVPNSPDSLHAQLESMREDLVQKEREAFREKWLNEDYIVSETLGSHIRNSEGEPIPNQVRMMEGEYHIATLSEDVYPEIFLIFENVRALESKIRALE